MSEYHIPVMKMPCIEGLNIQPEGVYVDVTFGGGGHAQAIVEKLTSGHLYGFDQDADAVDTALSNDQRFTLVESNFRHMNKFLRLHGETEVDGILADLGISSHQIDTPDRGFSFRYPDAPLDMRMDKQQDLTAENILNEYAEAELHKLFGMYGEVRNAKTLANKVVQHRNTKPLRTIADFNEVLQLMAPKGKIHKYSAQVFQAIRIEVNEELEALKSMLEQSVDLLKEGGRLVVMSYHSLEDRLVKNFIATGKFFGDIEKDMYGNPLKPFDAITRKPVIADQEEVEVNPRARSAKLRIAKRNAQIWPIV